ncbi:MAG TPA: hypothetical protein VEA44_04540, partial [Caulobacter sp.]|nr:hypothetical protein [Caulobacter sp.]
MTTVDGSTGTQVNGEAASNYAGQSISNVGDINGDGIDDFAIGATGVGGSSQGAVYVVFGTAAGLGATFSLASLDGTNGFQLNGGEYAQDFLGVSVAAAGDVNNDGIDDLIVGASGADPDGGGSGAAYVLFGKNTAVAGNFAANISASSLTGTTGFQISGTNGGDGLGNSVASGDFNGDGIEDLLVGANQADGYVGAAYVIFGTAAGFAGNIDVSTLNGANGFKMPAAATYDYAGTSVANAGDVNGDGIDDIIVGAMGADPGGSNSGAAYIVYGRNTAVAGNFGATVSLGGLNGTAGFRISGEAVGDQLGIYVDGAGDINNDGIDDIIIGANGGGNNGAVYVVFGSNAGFTNINVNSLDGTNGFQIDGEASGDNLGIRVTGLGDVNGDGIDDIAFGSTGHDAAGSNAGAAYVVFGRSTAFAATLALSSLDGTNGFQINGEAAGDNLSRVSGAGDFNNDGAMDIVVSTAFHDAAGTNAGAAWIIYGLPASSFAGTAGADDLTGAGGADTADGGASDDVIRGLGGDDTLNGGDNNDALHGGDNNDILSGDAGNDLIYGDAGGDDLAGGLGHDLLDGGAGADDMAGGAGDDTYVVDDASDTTTEAGGEGSDRVVASVTINPLGANIEYLTLTGVGDINGTGNALNNILDGNSGANTLSGGDGNDLIKGGDGNDVLNGDSG